MQRWIKLPNGAYLDATRVCYVSKVDTYMKLDDDGNSAGSEYAVTIAIDLSREQQMVISGTGEEIRTLMKAILGG
jgi:hypothetical protein